MDAAATLVLTTLPTRSRSNTYTAVPYTTGFQDKEYRARRDMLATSAQQYRYVTVINGHKHILM
jgi:hypothetical protein